MLVALHKSLKDVQLAVNGLVVVTPALETLMDSLLDYKVPASWGKAYPSMKPLGSWMRDLQTRTGAFTGWIEVELPKVIWIPMFTCPTGYLTALLQTRARKDGLAIDTLSWEFPVQTQSLSSFTTYAREGSYVHGMYLEGAVWDAQNGHLAEPRPMELFSPMPVIQFKPTDQKKKFGKGYSCPIYMFPFRSGSRERPSFVISADLKSGRVPPEFWTKRGTAMLLAVG